MTLIFNNSLNINGGGSGGGGGDYTQGPGITIGENNEISVNYDSAQALFTNASTGALGVNVDGTSIVIDGSALKANLPDVSNLVTNTQLATTLEAYPTNNALSNAISYQTISEPAHNEYTQTTPAQAFYITQNSVETGVTWTGTTDWGYINNFTADGANSSSYDESIIIGCGVEYDVPGQTLIGLKLNENKYKSRHSIMNLQNIKDKVS